MVAARRHTWHLQQFAAAQRPVFLDTDVDLSAVEEHRATARSRGARYSWVSYLIHATGRTLAEYPAANAALRGGPLPRIARYDGVDVKLTLDKTLAGHRVVLAGLLRDAHTSGLDEIQAGVDHYRAADPDRAPEFAGVRKLDRLPLPVGELVFRLGVGSLTRRRALMGTVSVTSLGRGAVDAFHSVGGTTITLGAGRVVRRPVVREDAVVIAPVQRLSLAFDHRVIDGALAAEVLTALTRRLTAVPSAANL